MTTKIRSDVRPVGSRIRRPARRLAEARRAAIVAVTYGREKANDFLLAAARRKALGGGMPTGLRTRRTVADRVREWALNVAARVVAAKIERDTWKVVLEQQKLTFERFVEAMQCGPALSRMARD